VNVLRITQASHDLLAAHTNHGRPLSGGIREAAGTWLIQVDDAVLERLKLLSEDPNEAIRLACSPATSKGLQ
jgi:hypothetical protein